MSGTRYLVDTNILLRFLSGHPPAQAQAARKLFGRAAAGEITLDVSPVIVAEAFYTLTSFYDVEQKIAAEKISVLLQTVNLGFADAFLAAGANEDNVSVASFDRDFENLTALR